MAKKHQKTRKRGGMDPPSNKKGNVPRSPNRPVSRSNFERLQQQMAEMYEMISTGQPSRSSSAASSDGPIIIQTGPSKGVTINTQTNAPSVSNMGVQTNMALPNVNANQITTEQWIDRQVELYSKTQSSGLPKFREQFTARIKQLDQSIHAIYGLGIYQCDQGVCYRSIISYIITTSDVYAICTSPEGYMQPLRVSRPVLLYHFIEPLSPSCVSILKGYAEESFVLGNVHGGLYVVTPLHKKFRALIYSIPGEKRHGDSWPVVKDGYGPNSKHTDVIRWEWN